MKRIKINISVLRINYMSIGDTGAVVLVTFALSGVVIIVSY